MKWSPTINSELGARQCDRQQKVNHGDSHVRYEKGHTQDLGILGRDDILAE